MCYHSITEFVFIMKALSDGLGKRSAIFQTRAWLLLRMSRILFAEKHIWMVFTTHDQTIICRQLFAGHVVGPWPMKSESKEKMC